MSQPTPLQLLDGRRATVAYADLMFAFGFARLGDATTAEHLREKSARQFDGIGTHRDFHCLAWQAFDCRIAEALRGDPHTGTLDDRCPEVIAALLVDDSQTPANSPAGEMAYVLGRVIECSTVLEPERVFNSYHRIGTAERIGVPWKPRPEPSDDWLRQLRTDDSREAIWQALRPSEAEAVKQRGAKWLDAVRVTSVQRLPSLLLALRTRPLGAIRGVLSGIISDLPPVGNPFTTAQLFSRIHFAVIDALVLAVVGTGPLPPEAERPERLELLRSVRPPVVKWVEAIS